MVATHQVIRLKGKVLGEKEPIVCSRKRSNKARYFKRGIGCKLEAKLVMIKVGIRHNICSIERLWSCKAAVNQELNY